MRRVHQEWRNRVAAEYGSAATTSRVVHGAIAVGLGRDLVDLALRIVRDELDHAELSAGCLEALGGEPGAPVLELADLVGARSEAFVSDLVDEVLRSFCLGETFAVPLFHAMRTRADHPAVQPVLTRVLRDEAIHRQFGWEALDALLAMDGEGVRHRAHAVLPGFVAAFRRAYGTPTKAPPITEAEQRMGLLPAEVYVEVFHATLDETIRPWFARRGIELVA